MKKIALGVAALLVVAFLALVAMISMQPGELAIERQIDIAAPPAVVAPYMHDMRKINEWSPWRDLDPNLVGTYSDQTTGVGAWYHWTGNDEVGEGKQTVLVADKQRVVHELAFVRPFEDVAESELEWGPNGKGGTTVVWRFRQEAGFGTKAANLFMDIEGMLEGDYERGLADLKPLVESESR